MNKKLPARLEFARSLAQKNPIKVYDYYADHCLLAASYPHISIAIDSSPLALDNAKPFLGVEKICALAEYVIPYWDRQVCVFMLGVGFHTFSDALKAWGKQDTSNHPQFVICVHRNQDRVVDYTKSIFPDSIIEHHPWHSKDRIYDFFVIS